MVTKGITHLPTNTLPVVVIQSAFPLLPLGRYLLPVTKLKKYQPRNNNDFFSPLHLGMYLLSDMECLW